MRGISLDIPTGQTVALLGPNGAGKSTTIDLLLGLATPDAGTVTLCGTTPVRATRAGLVGAMLQTGDLLRQLTVYELVDLAGTLYPAPRPTREALDLAGIAHLAGRKTHKLSGGQTQGVRFATAIVSNPALLVLDEPTVAMDVEVRRAFWQSVRALAAAGTTVVFATHYLDEADAHADRIVLMADGRIVADGATTEIKAVAGTRQVRATLPGASAAELGALPGVDEASIRGDAVTLTCHDSDAAARALFARYPAARDLDIAGISLEQAFLHLTDQESAAS
ncbi:MAG TPA: ABC transporter ATP-binding protein [Jatrophihabitans sp.]|nr:ABC transporter ATP-binding protein [Jatrophihabitans sp.]